MELLESISFEPNSILITGGAGFVGSHLVEKLLNEYSFNKIYIVDNLVRTNSLRNIENFLRTDKVKFIHGDLSNFDYESVLDPFSISHVFHLAATRINRCNDFNLEGHNSITNAGARLIDWVSRYSHIKLFFASSASVYQSPKSLPIKETDSCIPKTIYGSGKLYTELLLRSYKELYGLDYIVNRFFSVYGTRMDNAGSYTEVIFNWFNQIKRGKKDIFIYGNPDEKILDLVYVDDVVDAILLTMSQNRYQTFNVSTQVGITLTNLIDIIEEITDTKLNRSLLKEERTDIEKARIGDISRLKDIGWEAKVDIKQGLQKTWEWIKTL